MADRRQAIERIWKGKGRGPKIARTALSPLELIYRGAMAVRGKLYDRGILPSYDVSVPVLSVGNLTVGGTGKTPTAAWFAHELERRGAIPAVVLRGYGADEPLVHERLNPTIPVLKSADRLRGMREAIALGADAIVLDDAYQHRRARRDANVLLVSADGWTGNVRLLPAGPWREPLTAARRASLIIVTRKVATAAQVEAVRSALGKAAPSVPLAQAHLVPADLRSTYTGERLPLKTLAGADVMAIAAIAHPEAFFKQLAEQGAVVRPRGFPDHHSFSRKEVRALASSVEGSDFVVCTLKDAVKLERLWPAEAGSLWYVSQRFRIDRGERQISKMLDDLLATEQ